MEHSLCHHGMDPACVWVTRDRTRPSSTNQGRGGDSNSRANYGARALAAFPQRAQLTLLPAFGDRGGLRLGADSSNWQAHPEFAGGVRRVAA